MATHKDKSDNKRVRPSAKDRTHKNNKKKIKPAVVIALVLFVLIALLLVLKFTGQAAAINALKQAVIGSASVKSLDIGLSKTTIEGVKLNSKSGETWISLDKAVIRYNLLHIFKKPYGQKVLKSADIYGPSAILKYDDQGMLNLYSLFKKRPKKKARPLEVEAVVRIHKGRFTFADPRYKNYSKTAQPINGTVTLRGKNGIFIEKLTTGIEGTPAAISATGKLPSDFKSGSFHVLGKNVEGAPWLNYIIQSDQMKVEKATLDVRADLSSPDFSEGNNTIDSLDLQVQGKLKNGRIKLSFLPDPIQNLHGEVGTTLDLVRINEIEGIYNGAPIKVSGKIFNFGEHTTLQLHLDAPKIPLENMSKQPAIKSVPFKMKGNLSAQVGVEGTLLSPLIKAKLNFDRIYLKDQPVTQGRAALTYHLGVIQYDLLGARWGRGNFKGRGYVNIEGDKPHFLLEMSGTNADAGGLAKIFFPDYKIEATSDFDVKVIGTMDHPLVMGSSNFSGFRYDKYRLSRGNGRFMYFGGDLFLFGLKGSSGSGQISCPRGYLNLDHKYLDFVVNASNLALSSVYSGKLPLDKTQGNVSTRIVGTLKSPFLLGSFNEGSFNYNEDSFTRSSGSFFYGRKILFLSDARGLLQDARLNLTGWLQLDKNPGGELVFDAQNMKVNYLKAISPSLSSLPGRRRVNLSGYAGGTFKNMDWGFTGGGTLGSLAGFGQVRNGMEGLRGALMGWKVDLNDFIPGSIGKDLSPGRGDASLLLSGKGGRLKTYFLVNTPGGTALGLPLSHGRGAVSFDGPVISLEDVFIEGSTRGGNRASRWRLTSELYDLTSYWGIDNRDQRRTSLLARMYYAPYIYQDYKFTRQGWKLDVLGPVSLVGSNPLKSSYTKIKGLPEIWGTNSYFQLKSTGVADGPLRVTVDNTGRWRRPKNLVKVFDASVSGTVNTSTGRMNLTLGSQKLNLGLVGRNVNLTSLGLDLRQINKIISLDSIEGDATLLGKLAGTTKKPVWEGRVQVSNGVINNEYFSLDSRFQARGNGINIHDLKLLQTQGGYSGSGTIGFKPGINFDMNLKANCGKLSRILAFTPWRNLGARGLVSGDIKLQGTPEKPIINGDVTVDRGQVFNQPFSQLSMTFKSGVDSIALEKLSASIGKGKISGSGRMEKGNVDFGFSASSFPLSGLQFLQDSFPRISGTGDLALDLTGTRDKPIINLDVTAKDLKLRGNNFERAGGTIRWEDKTLSLKDVSLKAAQSYWNLDGNIKFASNNVPTRWKDWISSKDYPKIDVKSNLKDWSGASILQIADHPLKDKLEGTLNGNLQMSGTLNDPKLNVDIKATDGRIGSERFKQMIADVEYESSKLILDRLEYTADKANVTARGQYDEKTHQLSLQASAQDFPCSVIGVFIPKASKLSGLINANLKMWGKPTRPDMEATLFINEGGLGNFRFDQAGGEIQAQNGILTFNDLAIRKDNHKISFKGSIPLAIEKGGLVNVAPVDVTADIREKSLDILGLVVPFIEKSTGSLRGGLKISGQYPDLKIRGGTRIKDGSIKLSFLDNEITGLNVGIRFNGKKLSVRSFKGTMGDGNFNVEGYAFIDSKKFRIEDMKFNLVGENLTVMMPGLIKGKVETRVTLSGSQDRMVIGRLPGEKENNFLQVKNATMTMPGGQLNDISQLIPKKTQRKKRKDKKEKINDENETAADQFKFPMPIINQFILTLGDDVWLDYKGLFIQSKGSLMVARRPSQSLRVFGELAFSKGTLSLPFFSNTFKVSNGTAYFHGGDPIKDKATGKVTDYALNPSFDMNAETTVSDTEVFISYNGALDELQEALKPGSSIRSELNMYSIPSLSRNDIMKLLISGTVIGNITDPNSGDTSSQGSIEGAAVSALSSFILSPLTRSFGRALALSDLSLQYSPVGAFTFRVSKAVDAKERFYITFSQYVPPQGDRYDLWGLEYKYRPGMRIRVENAEDSFIYSLMGRIEFDTFPEFLKELFKATNIWGKKK